MKRIIKTTIVLMFMLIVLAGCTNTEYNVKINRNGSGKVEYNIQFDKNGLEEKMKENGLEKDSAWNLMATLTPFEKIIETAKNNGYDVEYIEEEGTRIGYKASRNYDNIQDLKIQDSVGDDYITITDDSGIKVEKNFFVTKFSQSVTVDTAKGGEVINTVKISYKFPKGFVKSSADKKNGIFSSQVTWNLGNKESKKIEYTVYTLNLLPIIIIVVIIIVIVYLVIKKVNKGKEKIEKNKDKKLDKKSKSKADKKADKKNDKKTDKKSNKKNDKN